MTRTKSRWKCTLKNGIMHVNNKDILFNKVRVALGSLSFSTHVPLLVFFTRSCVEFDFICNDLDIGLYYPRQQENSTSDFVRGNVQSRRRLLAAGLGRKQEILALYLNEKEMVSGHTMYRREILGSNYEFFNFKTSLPLYNLIFVYWGICYSYLNLLFISVQIYTFISCTNYLGHIHSLPFFYHFNIVRIVGFDVFHQI